MKIAIFLNQLGLGGTEKAAARWAQGLRQRGHELHLLALADGPRRREFEDHDIAVRILSTDAGMIAHELMTLRPNVIHVHAPGHPHAGDVLGEALASLSKKIPVLQTNVFGQSLNPKEDAWTDFRLYISWTSCVQAARRCFRKLNADFFRNASVAVYPLDPIDSPPRNEIDAFRERHGVDRNEILFGRLSRPEPNKWTDLALNAFRSAAAQNPEIKLLLREPPSQIREKLERATDRNRFVILPATADQTELTLTMASLDVILHTSVIGESFGYGIAEPMNLGKAVIANSTPIGDQAQIELVRNGECGFIASTTREMAKRMLELASNENLRQRLGHAARSHIRELADPANSTDRLEKCLQATAAGGRNSHCAEDLKRAQAASEYLDAQQFGHSWGEHLALRPAYYVNRFHQFRHRHGSELT